MTNIFSSAGPIRLILTVWPAVFLVCALPSGAIAADQRPAFNGEWTFNADLSDVTDDRVERAIKKAGGKIERIAKKKGDPPNEKYKGGPENEALYDHMAYDPILRIDMEGGEFTFGYAGGFERRFSSDRRSRTVTASGSATRDSGDFSFAYWEGDTLIVESRPRDGGRISERYSLMPETGQLRAELSMEPLKFALPIEIVRIYDRSGAAPEGAP